MIDLHTHSTFSDGSLTPEELVELAVKSGVSAIALTDHDGMMGIERFLAACQSRGVRGVPGVEISVDFQGGCMHMLGYFINHQDASVQDSLVQLRQGREERNRLILQRLHEIALPLEWDEVARLARESVIGRPHFAQAMIARGYVKDKDQAFDRYLGKGKPAYVERFRFSIEDSISLIRKAGGVSVLAHPYTMDLGRRRMRTLFADLASKGLQGIEAYYSEHSHEQQRFCINLAQELGLLVTGGSDFHGAMNPGIKLGAGFGGLNVPDEIVDLLYERAIKH